MYSESMQHIQEKIAEKKKVTAEEISLLFTQTMLLIKGETYLYNESDDILRTELYVSKNQFHQYVYKNNEILKEYIFRDNSLWEIKNRRKKYIPEFSIQNILTFWWDSFDLDKIKFEYELGGYYFCSYAFDENNNCKLILDSNYELIQIEMNIGNYKYTQKISDNTNIPETNLVYPKVISLYLDSTTVQKTELTEIKRLKYEEDVFEISNYKDETFFHSFINSIQQTFSENK